MDALWVTLIVGIVLALYLLPSLIAVGRHTEMVLVILVLDVFLGWTIVGWFTALAMAMLLPSVARAAPVASVAPAQASDPANTSAVAIPHPAARDGEFQIDPMRVAALSLIAPIIYQYWWLWRFFKLAQRERFARSRRFWWILVPLYGYAVIGRLLHDLQARLGPARPQAFNAQVALALIVAGNVSGGWAVRMGSIPFLVGGLAASCVLTAIALYQVQLGVNAYLTMTYSNTRPSGVFPGEVVAVAAGLAMLGLLALGTSPPSGRPAAPLAIAPVLRPSYVPTTPPQTPSLTPAPVPATGDVLSMTSQPGDYIGQGRSTTMTPPAWKFLANHANGPDTVTVLVGTVGSTNFARWTVWLAAPRGQSLHPGTYVNATRAAFRTGSAPGIDVFGDGRGCNNVYGSFTVTQLTMDPQGNVLAFAATFEQHCEQPTAPALRGMVRVGAATTEQQAELQTRPLG